MYISPIELITVKNPKKVFYSFQQYLIIYHIFNGKPMPQCILSMKIRLIKACSQYVLTHYKRTTKKRHLLQGQLHSPDINLPIYQKNVRMPRLPTLEIHLSESRHGWTLFTYEQRHSLIDCGVSHVLSRDMAQDGIGHRLGIR